MIQGEKIKRDTTIAAKQVEQVLEQLGVGDQLTLNPKNIADFVQAIAIFYLANALKEQVGNL